MFGIGKKKVKAEKANPSPEEEQNRMWISIAAFFVILVIALILKLTRPPEDPAPLRVTPEIIPPTQNDSAALQ